jgi:hypothetical protein
LGKVTQSRFESGLGCFHRPRSRTTRHGSVYSESLQDGFHMERLRDPSVAPAPVDVVDTREFVEVHP